MLCKQGPAYNMGTINKPLLGWGDFGLPSLPEECTAALIDICGQIETDLPSPGSVNPLGLHCDWTVMRPT